MECLSGSADLPRSAATELQSGETAMLDTFALAAAAIPRRNSDSEPQIAIGGMRAEQFDFAGDEPAFGTLQAGAEVFSPPAGDETEQSGVRITLTAAAFAQTNVPILPGQSELRRQSRADTAVAEDDLGSREVAAPPSVGVTGEGVSPENGDDFGLPPLPPPALPPVISVVIGSSEDDELSGTAIADHIEGRGGDDVLKGAGGSDFLFGGVGNDELRGGAGNDVLFGGKGADELHGGVGNDELRGGAGNDMLFGGKGADELHGGAGDDILVSGNGDDELHGGDGNDQLFGGKGQDDLHGGFGDDLLVGGDGRDLLTGGPGRDTFRTDEIDQGIDKVLDFEAGVGGDVIDLHNLLDFEVGDDINDFVQLIEMNDNIKVAVSVDGFGDDFTVVFNLVGQIGLDLGALVNDGNIQLTDAPSS